MRCSICAMLVLAFPLNGPAQAPPTIEQSLFAYHIKTSEPSLREALHDKNPAVRGFAAMQIAIKGNKAEASTLRSALRAEQNPDVRLNFARALTVLGDTAGKSEFANLCSDKSVRPDLRIMAADEIAPAVGEECFDAVVDVIASSGDPAVSHAALLSLERYDRAAVTGHPAFYQLRDALAKALASSVVPVRQEAAKCIGIYRIRDLRPVLERALKEEPDVRVRSVMRESIETLK